MSRVYEADNLSCLMFNAQFLKRIVKDPKNGLSPKTASHNFLSVDIHPPKRCQWEMLRPRYGIIKNT